MSLFIILLQVNAMIVSAEGDDSIVMCLAYTYRAGVSAWLFWMMKIDSEGITRDTGPSEFVISTTTFLPNPLNKMALLSNLA
jgi:hypothetical protein